MGGPISYDVEAIGWTFKKSKNSKTQKIKEKFIKLKKYIYFMAPGDITRGKKKLTETENISRPIRCREFYLSMSRVVFYL